MTRQTLPLPTGLTPARVGLTRGEMAPRAPDQFRRPTAPRWFHGCCLVLGAVAFAAPLAAQNLLWAESDGKLELVRHAEGNTAFVLEGGKSVPSGATRFFLKPTAEYLPVSIAVLDLKFQKGGRAISDEGLAPERLVHAGRFVFTADLEASRALDHVFLVLALDSKQIGDSVYLKGIGHLGAHERRRISIDEVTPFKLAGVRLGGVHLFVDGKEAFNSTLPESQRTDALDRMVATRVAAMQDAAVRPLYAADPVYPATLKDRIEGKVVVTCQVDAHGKVLNPTVTSATNPAFGPAALEAIRQWRFVPRVKDGHAVESAAEVPLDFTPP